MSNIAIAQNGNEFAITGISLEELVGIWHMYNHSPSCTLERYIEIYLKDNHIVLPHKYLQEVSVAWAIKHKSEDLTAFGHTMFDILHEFFDIECIAPRTPR